MEKRRTHITNQQSTGDFQEKEKKFDTPPDLHTKYVETINQYIENGHSTKIDINQKNDNWNKIVNYIPNHAVSSINKPAKICIAFDAGAKCQNASLNENSLKDPDLLNDLVEASFDSGMAYFVPWLTLKRCYTRCWWTKTTTMLWIFGETVQRNNFKIFKWMYIYLER